MLEIYACFTLAMINAVKAGYENFMSALVREALTKSKKYGKGDTLGLDAILEIEYMKAFKKFDNFAVFVTEETDKDTRKDLPDTNDPNLQPLVFISDPMDRSAQMQELLFLLLKKHLQDSGIDAEPMSEIKLLSIDDCVTVKELFQKYPLIEFWEKDHGKPVTITGATSAISCVYRGKIISTVIVNFITGKMFVACEYGIIEIEIDKITEKSMSLDEIYVSGKNILFPSIARKPGISQAERASSNRKFVTFAGKSGYMEHFLDSKIVLGDTEYKKNLYYDKPGGPSRTLYLSSLQEKDVNIGFILSNGEKITEWIHWLSFAKYAKGPDGERQLNVYEAFTEKISQKNGIPMSVSPSLSIFKNDARHGHHININKIRDFDNPSHFRSMIVVCNKDNNWLDVIMQTNGYRSINSYF